MRNFKTAAVAAATAATVALSGTAIASAQEEGSNSSFSLSSQIGLSSDAWTTDENGDPIVKEGQQVTGEDAFGSEQAEDHPLWFDLFKGGAIAGGVLSAIGAAIAGYNYAVFTGIIPQHILAPIFGR